MDGVLQLRELFPFHSSAQLQAALDQCNGSTDAAAEKLLQQTTAGAHGSARHHTASTSCSSGRGPLSAKPCPSTTSWAGLRDSQAPNVASGSSHAPHSPLYIRPRGRFTPSPPVLTENTFPALNDSHLSDKRLLTAAAEPAGEDDPHKTACSSACSSTTRWRGSAHSEHQQAGRVSSSQQQQRQQQHQGLLAPRRSLSAQSFAEAARQHSPHHMPQQSRHPSPLPFASQAPAPHHRQQLHNRERSSAPYRHNDAYVGWQQQQQQQQLHRVTQQLSELHPLCNTPLPQEVLESVDGDAATAAATALPQPVSMPASPAQQQQQHSEHMHDQQQQQDVQRAAAGPLPQSTDGGDLYHVMRREAIRLTNKWQKVMRRAAAAAADGDHTVTKQLAAEARALKAAADEAHAAAAVKIEVANNTNSSAGLWELDLHGLHAREALLALQERLALLQSLVQDILGQAQAVSPAVPPSATSAQHPSPSSRLIAASGQFAGAAAHHAAPTSGGGRQHLLAQLLLADDEQAVPLHVRQSAERQELRVIVGKGNNSSGGEASLPRVVEQWLSENKFRYVIRTGAIDVKLKRLVQLDS